MGKSNKVVKNKAIKPCQLVLIAEISKECVDKAKTKKENQKREKTGSLPPRYDSVFWFASSVPCKKCKKSSTGAHLIISLEQKVKVRNGSRIMKCYCPNCAKNVEGVSPIILEELAESVLIQQKLNEREKAIISKLPQQLLLLDS